MTMTNAEWMIQQGYKFDDLNVLYTKDVGVYAISIKKNGAYTCLGTIKKIGAIYAFMEWLDQEHKEPILDEVEKRYLAGVIRPFRTDVQYIAKLIHFTGDEEIIVSCNYNKLNSVFSFDLPPFEKGTMYKGMEPNQKYTPEELGL